MKKRMKTVSMMRTGAVIKKYQQSFGMYSQSLRDEALLVTAMVDDQQVEVLIFKGFSSCLSYNIRLHRTHQKPFFHRARIKFIDRAKAPFNPANTELIEKGLTWEAFQTRISSG